MNHKSDIKAMFKYSSECKRPIFSGIRPAVLMKDGYLTASVITFSGASEIDRELEVSVDFLSPKYYPNSLWIGKSLDVFGGSKIIGCLTVTEIINPVLDIDSEKWIFIDGRDIHNTDDFFDIVSHQLGCEWVRGFGELRKAVCEPTHFVWIFYNESKRELGKNFEQIIAAIRALGFGDEYLELYEEHSF